MERQDDADPEARTTIRPLSHGIGHEGVEDLLLQHETDQAAKDQEHQHPEQEDAGRG